MIIPVEIYGLLGIIISTAVISVSLVVWARYKDKR